MLSALLLHEKLTATKALCVCISMAGVILVTTADGAGGGKKPHSVSPGAGTSGLNFTRGSVGVDAGGFPPFPAPPGGGTTPVPVTPIVSHMFGDILSLVAALMFAIYSVLIKWLIPSEKIVRMPMFFGFSEAHAVCLNSAAVTAQCLDHSLPLTCLFAQPVSSLRSYACLSWWCCTTRASKSLMASLYGLFFTV